MLPFQNRLKKKKDFERVFKKGKSFKEGFLTLRLLKNDLEITRAGFVIGLKVSKKASLRNKIKRKLKRLVKERLSQTAIGLDIVLTVNQSWKERDFLETPATLDKLFKKAKI